MATKTVEEAQTTILNAWTKTRAELRAFVERGIDLAEKQSKAAFRFARTLSKRLGGAARKSRKKA
jgi:hypothetical protein